MSVFRYVVVVETITTPLALRGDRWWRPDGAVDQRQRLALNHLVLVDDDGPADVLIDETPERAGDGGRAESPVVRSPSGRCKRLATTGMSPVSISSWTIRYAVRREVAIRIALTSSSMSCCVSGWGNDANCEALPASDSSGGQRSTIARNRCSDFASTGSTQLSLVRKKRQIVRVEPQPPRRVPSPPWSLVLRSPRTDPRRTWKRSAALRQPCRSVTPAC